VIPGEVPSSFDKIGKCLKRPEADDLIERDGEYDSISRTKESIADALHRAQNTGRIAVSPARSTSSKPWLTPFSRRDRLSSVGLRKVTRKEARKKTELSLSLKQPTPFAPAVDTLVY
jgi:hypothetical protein